MVSPHCKLEKIVLAPSLFPFLFLSFTFTCPPQPSLLGPQKVSSPQVKGRARLQKPWGGSFPFSRRKTLQQAEPPEAVTGSFGWWRSPRLCRCVKGVQSGGPRADCAQDGMRGGVCGTPGSLSALGRGAVELSLRVTPALTCPWLSKMSHLGILAPWTRGMSFVSSSSRLNSLMTAGNSGSMRGLLGSSSLREGCLSIDSGFLWPVHRP